MARGYRTVRLPVKADEIRADEVPVRMSARRADALEKIIGEMSLYDGVKLLPGRFQTQIVRASEVYGAVPNDDILKGFRRNAGLPAPGNDMRGWCTKTTAGIFGQLGPWAHPDAGDHEIVALALVMQRRGATQPRAVADIVAAR